MPSAPPPIRPPYHPSPNYPPLAVPLDSAGNLISDTLCRQCGYNLRNLNIAGRCPECGAPIELSVYGDLLRFCDPAWLKTLRRGIYLFLGSIVILAIEELVQAVGGRRAVAGPEGSSFGSLLGAVEAAFLIAGGWLITTPDPGGGLAARTADPDEVNPSRLRALIRFSLVIEAAGKLFQIAATTIDPHFTDPGRRLMISGVSTGAIKIIGQVAQIVYVGRVAERVPDRWFESWTKPLAWGIGVSYSLLLLGSAAWVMVPRRIAGAAPAPPPSIDMLVVGCAALAALIALAFFVVVYVVMLVRLAWELRRQEEYARQIWKARGAV